MWKRLIAGLCETKYNKLKHRYKCTELLKNTVKLQVQVVCMHMFNVIIRVIDGSAD